MTLARHPYSQPFETHFRPISSATMFLSFWDIGKYGEDTRFCCLKCDVEKQAFSFRTSNILLFCNTTYSAPRLLASINHKRIPPFIFSISSTRAKTQ